MIERNFYKMTQKVIRNCWYCTVATCSVLN
jgi:hypothetical protein